MAGKTTEERIAAIDEKIAKKQDEPGEVALFFRRGCLFYAVKV